MGNFLQGQAKMVTLKSLRNQLMGARLWQYPPTLLVPGLSTHLNLHVTLQQNVAQFISCWAIKGALYKVEEGQLVLLNL